MNTMVTRITSWYDRHTRSWVTQACNAAGDQIGDAQYDGNATGRDCSRRVLAKEHGLPDAPYYYQPRMYAKNKNKS